jgi:hypothetical protein
VRGQDEFDRQVEQRTDPSEGWFVLSIAAVVWTRTGFRSTQPTMLCDRQDLSEWG